MIKNYDQPVKINDNPNWTYISDDRYEILITGGSGSGKPNVLLNLIKHQWPFIGKIYLYVKDPLKSKYQFLVNGREKVRIENLKSPKALTDYSRTIYDVYENLEDYNPTKKGIVFDDMIADMESNKKFSPIVTEVLLRGRKLNISLAFILQSYFKVPVAIRLNATHIISWKF